MSDSLSRMKGQVTGYQVHEGSYLHDAFAPVALELDTLTDQTLPAALDAHMPDTATGADLDRVAAAYGMARKAAAFAVGEVTVTGTPGAVIAQNVPVSTAGGTIFLTDAVATIPSGGVVNIPVTAALAGVTGNVPTGSVTVLPIGVAGVHETTNSQPMTGGADAESDTSLRERLLMKLRLPSASGTESDYVRWARDVQGVAAARCVGLWNGPGTVKVIIAGDGMTAADAETIDRCADYLASVRPIGAQVTVVSVSALTVNISANVDLQPGYTPEGAAAEFAEAVYDYFATHAFASDYLSHAQIGALLLRVEGVSDYTDLLLNGISANISLDDDQVPALGTVTLT